MHEFLLPSSWCEADPSAINRAVAGWGVCSFIGGGATGLAIRAGTKLIAEGNGLSMAGLCVLAGWAPILLALSLRWFRWRRACAGTGPWRRILYTVVPAIVGIIVAAWIVDRHFQTASGSILLVTIGCASAALLALSLGLNRLARWHRQFGSRGIDGRLIRSPANIAVEHRIGDRSGRTMAAVHLAAFVLWTVRYGQTGFYAAIYALLMLVARLVRLRNEASSFRCSNRDCGLVFDDPPLRCRCGGPSDIKTFPRLQRPLFATCPACGSVYPTWWSTDALMLAGLSLHYRLCRLGCPHGPAASPTRRAVTVVPFDSTGLAWALELIDPELGSPGLPVMTGSIQHLQSRRFAITLLSPDSPETFWVGNADAVLIVGSRSEVLPLQVTAARRRIVIPQIDRQWGEAARLRPRGWERIWRAPRNDLAIAPFGRRNVPRLIALDRGGRLNMAAIDEFSIMNPTGTELADAIER